MHRLGILALVALSFPGTSSVPQVPPTQVEFASEDKLTVTADLYAVANRDAPTIVLVHQSGSSRGEYRQIAPALTRLGFNALAVDIRWGHQDKWNAVMNKTAERFGTPAILVRNDQREMRSAQEASLNDIRGAVRWLRAQGYSGSKLLWGASISANMVLEIAAESQEDVAAVLAFSPGEYHPDQPNEMKTTVANLRVPTLIVCGAEEQSASRPIFEAIRNDDKKFYQAAKGHGSSILLDDTSNWEPVISFVKRFGPGRSEHGDATLDSSLGGGSG